MESEFYLQARREWDERYGDLVLGKRNPQIAPFPSASLRWARASSRQGFAPPAQDSENFEKPVERATGVEPATSSLGSWHSTAELRPL